MPEIYQEMINDYQKICLEMLDAIEKYQIAVEHEGLNQSKSNELKKIETLHKKGLEFTKSHSTVPESMKDLDNIQREIQEHLKKIVTKGADVPVNLDIKALRQKVQGCVLGSWVTESGSLRDIWGAFANFSSRAADQILSTKKNIDSMLSFANMGEKIVGTLKEQGRNKRHDEALAKLGKLETKKAKQVAGELSALRGQVEMVSKVPENPTHLGIAFYNKNKEKVVLTLPLWIAGTKAIKKALVGAMANMFVPRGIQLALLSPEHDPESILAITAGEVMPHEPVSSQQLLTGLQLVVEISTQLSKEQHELASSSVEELHSYSEGLTDSNEGSEVSTPTPQTTTEATASDSLQKPAQALAADISDPKIHARHRPMNQAMGFFDEKKSPNKSESQSSTVLMVQQAMDAAINGLSKYGSFFGSTKQKKAEDLEQIKRFYSIVDPDLDSKGRKNLLQQFILKACEPRGLIIKAKFGETNSAKAFLKYVMASKNPELITSVVEALNIGQIDSRNFTGAYSKKVQALFASSAYTLHKELEATRNESSFFGIR